MQLNQELDVLSELNNTPGKNDKLAILKNYSNNSRLAELLDATFNFKRKFFIKKVPLVKHIKRDSRDKHDEFMQLLKDLESGAHRGLEAEAMVFNFLSDCTDAEYKWYGKVIQKDLKCGFSAKTAIKAGFINIPNFDVMLAKDANKCKKLKELVAKGVWISPKLDGYRCLAIVNNGTVTLLSRNGTEYHNFPTIVQSFERCFPTGQHVFDGEIMSDNFQAMQKTAFSNKSHKSVGDVKYHAFGYIDYNEWISQKFKMLTKERLALLEAVSSSFDNNLVKVDQIYRESLHDIYMLQTKWEMMGYEGAMVLPNIPYYLGKKSNRLLKFKTMLSQDCVVTGMYEGKAGTRLEGLMGGIVVRQENDEICECGTGFSDEDRKVMWENQELYIGNLVEVKYQELTNDGIMRFPVFMRWRNDK